MDHPPEENSLREFRDTDPALQIQNLTRVFGQHRAVDGINLTLPGGVLFGLVGPDGAGKTTTLRMLAGLLDISEGSATVRGIDLKENPESVKPHIGYMAQDFSLYRKLSVVENLTFFADLYGVSPQEKRRRMKHLLDFAGLQEFKDRRAMHLSGGMKKKLALACTLIHEPPILLLDEPTTGVDPVSRREFWDILAELHLRGTTILLSTPYMDEADRCSRVGFIFEGKMMVHDTPGAIRDNVKGELIKVIPDDWRAAREIAPGLSGVREVQTYGESLHLLVDNAMDRRKEIKNAFARKGIGIKGIRTAPIRMEEAFISLIHGMEEGKATEKP